MAPQLPGPRRLAVLCLCLCLCWLLPGGGRADNPLVPGVGMADPHIHVFEHVAYMYAGRDLSPNVTHFVMPDWNVWTSTDLVHWEHATTISPNQTYMGNPSEPECWAVDVSLSAATGNYSFFFSNHGTNLGVMTATRPDLADATDVYGRPLVSLPGAGGVVTTNLSRGAYDPSVLIDEDGAAYISFGVHDGGSSYGIARLEPSLVGLAEPPRRVEFLDNPVTGEAMPGDDKSTLHKNGGLYYLSAGASYSTAASPYGPYTFRGSSNPHAAVSGNRSFGDTGQGHGRYWTWNGQWFHVWCEFVEQNNTGTVVPGRGYARWRDAWMTYTHYRHNGEMVDDWAFLNLHGATGVGQYDAGWPRIQAEWFMAGHYVSKVEGRASNTSFVVLFTVPTAWVRFPLVHNLPAKGTLYLQLAATDTARGMPAGGAQAAPDVPNPTFQLLSGSQGDRPVATCDEEGVLLSCPYASGLPEGSTDNLRLVYVAGPEAIIALDWFNLTAA